MRHVKNFLSSSILATFIFVFSTSIASAQVLINEFSSNSDTEWVELYNTSSATVDLTGWTIQDGSQSPKSISGSISANAYFVFENSSGWLNNNGSDSITVKDSGGVTVDTLSYGSGSSISIPDSDKCSARTPSGSSTWSSNISCTKLAANPNAPTATPNPTATPTNTPTATPTPTSIATKSPTPKPTPTKSPTAKPSPTDETSPTPYEEVLTTTPPELLGLTTESSPSSEPIVQGDRKLNFPVIAILLIISGVVCVGVPIIWSFRNKSRYNNSTSENS